MGKGFCLYNIPFIPFIPVKQKVLFTAVFFWTLSVPIWFYLRSMMLLTLISPLNQSSGSKLSMSA
jgi:hypothetical protein